MNRDLINSPVERQNILNNSIALKDEQGVLSESIACIIFDLDYPPELHDLLNQYKNQTN
ncbi:MAG: hypothetical protein U0N72_05640 [Dialister invisus]|uniref:hypothetical protein n=1 Tax=Dialister invisus TaxID=218538 RepID=UPI002F93EC2B